MTTGSCTFFGKNSFFFKCFIFGESQPILVCGFLFSVRPCTVWESALQNFMQHILLNPSKVYRKNWVFKLSTHFQFSHFRFIHSVSLGTMLALLWSFLVFMGGKADGQDLFLVGSADYSDACVAGWLYMFLSVCLCLVVTFPTSFPH